MTGCFYCEGYTDYHPVCDHPGCTNDTHGNESGAVPAMCEQHGGQGVPA